MKISFVLKKEPVVDPWVSHFDNSDWAPGGGTSWTGSSWTGGFGLQITDIGTWTEGYRPTKMRVTFTGGPTNMTLKDVPGSLDNIAHDAAYVSGQEIDLDFSGLGDINEMRMGLGSVTVTNIEFLE